MLFQVRRDSSSAWPIEILSNPLKSFKNPAEILEDALCDATVGFFSQKMSTAKHSHQDGNYRRHLHSTHHFVAIPPGSLRILCGFLPLSFFPFPYSHRQSSGTKTSSIQITDPRSGDSFIVAGSWILERSLRDQNSDPRFNCDNSRSPNSLNFPEYPSARDPRESSSAIRKDRRQDRWHDWPRSCQKLIRDSFFLEHPSTFFNL